MSQQVTLNQREVILALTQGKKLIVHHCSLCGYRCGYWLKDDMLLMYDPGCHCTERYLREPRELRCLLDLAGRPLEIEEMS